MKNAKNSLFYGASLILKYYLEKETIQNSRQTKTVKLVG